MSSEQVLKEMLAKYKRFEKCFFRADKEKDMITHIKLKHQFRAMLIFSLISLTHGIYMLITQGFVVVLAPLLLLSVLIGYRIKSYNFTRILFLILMMAIPPRYTPSSLVFAAPVALLFSNIQTLIQTQSQKMMVIHMSFQAIMFYWFGVENMVAKVKEMSTEELTESVRLAVNYAFQAVLVNLLCMKLFYTQFSSLLRKINTLKDDIAKVNNQLNIQNLKLQNNLEMKDVFIYTFSHELKNALNGLLGNLTLAYDSAVVPEVIQFLSSAKVCGEVLKNFIHNILDSGKLENGNLEVAPERKDVMSFMQNAWSICGRIIQNKRLKGSLEIEKNVPKLLELDEQRMIQILLNLVSNAVKFTEKGHVRIHVSWQTVSTSYLQLDPVEEEEGSNQGSYLQLNLNRDKSEKGENGWLHDTNEFPSNNHEECPSMKENHHLVTEYEKKFMVGSKYYQLDLKKDTWNREEVLSSKLHGGSKGILKIQVLDSGCGMSDEDQAKLFQKFSQVSSIEGQRKVGTGLGLWICKELANRLDGDIKTRSKVGVGSVFELTVRARVPFAPARTRSPLASYYQTALNYPMRYSLGLKNPNKLKILVADDDSFNIELMKNYLKKCEISYLCAYDGEEAVNLFKNHYQEIGFVITDNFMPKKTGTEAANEIAEFLEERRLPAIPIICISGDLKVSVDAKGITNVIQKPINFERLKEELMFIFPQLNEKID